MWAPWYSETTAPTRPLTQNHVPKHLNIQQRCCENSKSRIYRHSLCRFECITEPSDVNNSWYAEQFQVCVLLLKQPLQSKAKLVPHADSSAISSAFKIPHGWKSPGMKSGDRGGHGTGQLDRMHWPVQRESKNWCTSRIKWTGCPSCRPVATYFSAFPVVQSKHSRTHSLLYILYIL